MRTFITAFMLVATLGLVSCGGGNDVASSGATAVSAAAPTPASTTTATTEPKVNGQIDERTGVAPVVAQLTVWTVYSNGGCGNSVSVNLFANGPPVTNAQVRACITAAGYAQTLTQCNALGGSFSPYFPQSIYGSCTVQNGPDYYNPVPPPPTY